MGIPFWKSVSFFVVMLWISLRLFPSNRELGLYYSASQGFDVARFYLAKQFYHNPADQANTIRYLRSLESAGNTREFEHALEKLYRMQKNPVFVHRIAADYYERRENLEEAARHWVLILRKDPSLKDVRSKFVSFCLLNHHAEQLMDFYDDEVREGIASLQTYYDLGRLYLLAKRTEDAQWVYKSLLERYPQESLAQLQLIRIFEYEGKLDAAARLYLQLAAEYPREEKIVLECADFLVRHERFTEAAELVRGAAPRFPNSQRMSYLLVDILYRTGDKQGAVAILEKLHAEGKIKLPALKTMGEIYSEQKQYLKAQGILKEYHEKTGGDYRSHHILGDVLSGLGDKSGGRREYEEALKLLRS
jgi:tetratricopeptide (TPR) repeat protein